MEVIEIGISENNPTGSTFSINSLIEKAKCNFEAKSSETNKSKLTLEVNFSEIIEIHTKTIDEIKEATKEKGYIVIDSKKNIDMKLIKNYIRFDTKMENTQLTLTFTLAGKAGGTSGNKAGGTSGTAM